MARPLAIAITVWPLLLAGSVAAAVQHRAPWYSSLAYFAGSQICHQQSDRSFHSAGVKWPVCARCSGLYLGAPIGAWLALLRWRRVPRAGRGIAWLAVLALPTAATFLGEHGGLATVSNVERFVAALPLGGALAWIVVRAAAGSVRGIE